jgi:sucrose phosphorylase
MRKSGLPVLKVRFPDGTESLTGILLPTNSIQPTYSSRFKNIVGLSKEQVLAAITLINNAIAENQDFAVIDFKELHALKQKFFK